MLKFAKIALIASVTVFCGSASASASAASCDMFGNLKSIDSGIPITLEITNRADSYRAVLWLDYQGNPVDYYGLNAGQSYKQQTFVGHPWMFANDLGDCTQITVPQKDTTRIDIKN